MKDSKVEIGELWRQVNREMHERFRQIFREMPMQPMAMILLRELHHEPGLTVSELSRRSGTVKSHVSKMVDHLVQKGLLERQPDPSDQRLVRLFMTQRAEDHKCKVERKAQSVWAEVMAGVPQEELDQVETGLRLLLNALAKSRPTEQDS